MSSRGTLYREQEINPRFNCAKVEDGVQDQSQPMSNGNVVLDVQLDLKILHLIGSIGASASGAPEDSVL